MQSNQPYAPPSANLDDDHFYDDTYEPSMWALSGRIGRVRFLAYTMLAYFLFSVLIGFAVGFFAAVLRLESVSNILFFVLMVPVVVYFVALSVRRLHDLNRNGWLLLIAFIPFIGFFFSLYMIFAPGTTGSNNYGPAPSKNQPWMYLGVIFPFVFVGIIAAVAIPAYHDYTRKAKEAQMRHQREAMQPAPAASDAAPAIPAAPAAPAAAPAAEPPAVDPASGGATEEPPRPNENR